jgi:hypothetical protein
MRLPLFILIAGALALAGCNSSGSGSTGSGGSSTSSASGGSGGATGGSGGAAGSGASSGGGGSGGASGGSGGAGGTGGGALQNDCVPGSGKDYEVGPGLKYQNIGDVPWKTLGPGDTVRIHARPDPYKEKIMIMQSGSADAPLKICGIPDELNRLPKIQADGATSPASMDYPDYTGFEPLGLIIGANNYGVQNKYLEISYLDISGARESVTFQDSKGNTQKYGGSCVAFYRTAHVVLRGNVIHDCDEGLFYKSTTNDNDISSDYLIEGNYFHHNGAVGSYLVHNAYTEGVGVVYQFNRFEDLIPGAQGGCLKDRSAGTVIRYNWIRGCQRNIDLVETQDGAGIIDKDPSYAKSYVYGNALIYDQNTQGSTFIHYGGDQGVYDTYRQGTIYIYNNTVVSLVGDAELVRVDSEATQGTAEVWGNILYAGGKTPGSMYLLGVNYLDSGVWGNLHLAWAIG